MDVARKLELCRDVSMWLSVALPRSSVRVNVNVKEEPMFNLKELSRVGKGRQRFVFVIGNLEVERCCRPSVRSFVIATDKAATGHNRPQAITRFCFEISFRVFSKMTSSALIPL